MFSVIIPLFNKAGQIQQSVCSVLNQTCEDFELIVVNDGSTDAGLEIVRSFDDSRILIIDQSNAGVSIARNNGVTAAKFEYIAFLDADDWWAPRYLEAMKGLIESYPDAGIYSAKYATVKNGRKKPAVISMPDGFTSGYINYFEAYSRSMWMPLFPSSAILPMKVFIEHGGFKPNLKMGEDFELWVRIALKHPVAFLNNVLVYYNQDVNVSVRGVNHSRFHSPRTHYVYNLEQFKADEKLNPDLKILLDRLKGKALLKYYLHNVNPVETAQILQQIDFENLPLSLRRQYAFPKPLILAYRVFMKLGSTFKQWMIRSFIHVH